MKSKFFFSIVAIIGTGLMIYILLTSSILAQFITAGSDNLANKQPGPEDSSVQSGVVQDRRLTEISGIAASVRYPDSYWVHNDSGNPAEVFLITESGRTQARLILDGAKNIDWEDISVFRHEGRSFVCVGDIGDNAGKRSSCQLYIFEEPELPISAATSEIADLQVSDVSVFEFTYADGPRNCEAMAFDSGSKQIFLFQKANDRNQSKDPLGVYVLSMRPNLKLISNVARRVADLPHRLATGATFSNDFRHLLICDYTSAHRLTRAPATNWIKTLQQQDYQRISLPVQQQREAICFTLDGKSAIVVSEFAIQPIWKIDLSAVSLSVNSNTSRSERIGAR